MLIAIATAAAGCGTPRPNSGMNEMMERQQGPWAFTYADGSGNAYRFRGAPEEPGAHLEYDPVTPEMSSSGTYSGGKAWKGRVDETRVGELWTRLSPLEGDPSIRAKTRMLGTGSFRIVSAAGERAFLVERSPQLQKFEEFLVGLRR